MEEALARLVRVGELVDPAELVEDVRDDPADNRVLEAAAEGRVDFVVNGDRHLRDLGEWRGIPIAGAAQFLDEAG